MKSGEHSGDAVVGPVDDHVLNIHVGRVLDQDDRGDTLAGRKAGGVRCYAGGRDHHAVLSAQGNRLAEADLFGISARTDLDDGAARDGVYSGLDRGELRGLEQVAEGVPTITMRSAACVPGRERNGSRLPVRKTPRRILCCRAIVTSPAERESLLHGMLRNTGRAEGWDRKGILHGARRRKVLFLGAGFCQSGVTAKVRRMPVDRLGCGRMCGPR